MIRGPPVPDAIPAPPAAAATLAIDAASPAPTRAPAPPLGPPPAGRASADEILERFLGWTAARGLTLYPAQEEALFEVLADKHVVLATPTGSGKSLVATAFLYKALCDGVTGFYSCPVKALVNEKFFDLCAAFGAENVGLVTGDASVNRNAPVLVGTAEILANMALRTARPPAERVVMDEFHYYGDRERGIAWQLPLITLPGTTFLLMSATLGETGPIEKRLSTLTGREVASVRGALRPVPLSFEYRDSPLHETIAALIGEGRAPIYLVNFTQRAAAEEAQNLMSVELSSKPEKEAIKAALGSFRFDSPNGKELQRFVRHGVGVHHAGLLPRYRRLVERLAQQGLLKVVSGTDTLGVGVNIPIRTVLFSRLCKYDGARDGILSVREFLQIAGRAGRKGFDERGWVVAQAPAHVVENKRLAAKAAATGRKVHAQKPPQKGYVHWDKGTFERLVAGTPEPLESRFAVSHGLLLALLQSERSEARRGGGYRRLLELIDACHDSDTLKRRHRRTAAACFRTLRKAGLIELVVDERARGAQVRPHTSLQRDFSLHHTLSLYLVDTLALLDPATESYPLDVLTLVEAILENPRPVLFAQLDKLKGETIDALKAQGMEYEQRIEELDKLEWPKPNREFIYDTFNAFADRHPWVGAENIAPKSVAREMLERFCSFHDYVRDYGLQRSEGVLLRYLSDAYRTLAQSVPARFVTPPLEELALDLGSLVRNVDASLLEEWEALRDGAGPAVASEGSPRPRAPDLAADPRALAARVRTELHRLLGALARRDWEDALLALAQRPDSDLPPWTADRLAAEMAPYYAEHKTVVTAPAARTPRHTVLHQIDRRRWDVEQRLVDPEGDEDWAIHGHVALPEGPVDEAPIVELVRIGR
jgi:superfamily II RNA helicase